MNFRKRLRVCEREFCFFIFHIKWWLLSSELSSLIAGHVPKRGHRKKKKEKIIFVNFRPIDVTREKKRASAVQEDSAHSATRPGEPTFSATSARTNCRPRRGLGWATPVSVTPHPITHDAPRTTVSTATVSNSPGLTFSGSAGFLLFHVQTYLTAEHDWLWRQHITLETHTHMHTSCMFITPY